jgi:hypothetical protein
MVAGALKSMRAISAMAKALAVAVFEDDHDGVAIVGSRAAADFAP